MFYRYWEAVKHWDEALQLTPTSAILHEMKSQVSFHLLDCIDIRIICVVSSGVASQSLMPGHKYLAETTLMRTHKCPIYMGIQYFDNKSACIYSNLHL